VHSKGLKTSPAHFISVSPYIYCIVNTSLYPSTNSTEMSLLAFDPLSRDLRRLQRQMENAFTSFEKDLQSTTGPEAHVWSPRCDIKEQEGQLKVHAELPGVPKEKINVELNNGILTISGERNVEKKEHEGKWYRVERSYGSFARSFDVGGEIKPEDIKANYKDGVLEVCLPQPQMLKQAPQAKQITIQ
jgi:HSP20 family protein